MHIAIADGAEGVNAVSTMLVLVGNEIGDEGVKREGVLTYPWKSTSRQ